MGHERPSVVGSMQTVNIAWDGRMLHAWPCMQQRHTLQCSRLTKRHTFHAVRHVLVATKRSMVSPLHPKTGRKRQRRSNPCSTGNSRDSSSCHATSGSSHTHRPSQSPQPQHLSGFGMPQQNPTDIQPGSGQAGSSPQAPTLLASGANEPPVAGRRRGWLRPSAAVSTEAPPRGGMTDAEIARAEGKYARLSPKRPQKLGTRIAAIWALGLLAVSYVHHSTTG